MQLHPATIRWKDDTGLQHRAKTTVFISEKEVFYRDLMQEHETTGDKEVQQQLSEWAGLNKQKISKHSQETVDF